MTKRIFLTSSVNRVAGDIAKNLGGAKKRKLLYIYTACEKTRGELWEKNDYNALRKVGFEMIEYTFTGQTKEMVRKELKKVDVIYIGGGNTFYLLEKIQLAHCAALVRESVSKGKIYIGTSAGSIVAGPDISPVKNLDKIKEAPKLKGYKGLGLVDFVVLPHWGSEHFKSPYLRQRLKDNYNTKNKLVLLNDYQYIQVEGDWQKIVEVKHKK
jgi:dipeptidase E